MARNKPLSRKLILAAALNRNKPIPAWAYLKTNRRVRRKPRRHWRRVKLGV
ncbi:MAG: 50S ribosomal protein L39e [Thermoproteota archaeon]|nr:MAG: 50S ribosomal protein L39e [Candidatus Korarchaeota archaeon]RLG55561.1 MAG: 50S ribosomal protein L39e [Candidatus Korarchaeota archaeon]